MFKIKDKVVTVKNAGKVFTVVETGECNSQGVQWVKIKYENKSKWTLADGLRSYSDSNSISIPDGIIVVAKEHSLPEFFRLPRSKATQEQIEEFVDAILRMWLSKKPDVGLKVRYKRTTRFF